MELKARNILSKEQMQNVKGGASGTCGYFVWTGDTYIIGYGVSKEEALGKLSHWGGGNWCCDSCKNTWYYKEIMFDQDSPYYQG
ncbi:MAG: rSAM-modified peptide [Alistipes sp.]